MKERWRVRDPGRGHGACVSHTKPTHQTPVKTAKTMTIVDVLDVHTQRGLDRRRHRAAFEGGSTKGRPTAQAGGGWGQDAAVLIGGGDGQAVAVLSRRDGASRACQRQGPRLVSAPVAAVALHPSARHGEVTGDVQTQAGGGAGDGAVGTQGGLEGDVSTGCGAGQQLSAGLAGGGVRPA